MAELDIKKYNSWPRGVIHSRSRNTGSLLDCGVSMTVGALASSDAKVTCQRCLKSSIYRNAVKKQRNNENQN